MNKIITTLLISSVLLLSILPTSGLAIEKRSEFTESRAAFSKYRSRTSRIVGGSVVPPRAYPWIVAIEDVDFGLNCGGTLISKNKILTAAHCTFLNGKKKYPLKYLQVRVGSDQLQSGGQVFRVASTVAHPKYNPITFDYDVAVWTIKTTKRNPLILSDNVNIVNLPATCADRYGNTVLDCLTGATKPGTQVEVAGWGTTYYSDDPKNPAPLSQDLLDVGIPIISNNECSIMYGVNGPITDRMICAGEAGKDSCLGDSGGPLFAYLSETRTGLQTGIVSFGIDCGTPKYFGVYTRISNPEIRAFIREKAKI